ncbi:MAG TPA: hypothetical protein VLG28_08080 [Acidimicrobiia bacterium]|nr:hypothetical protein [Acidimicrobiia bacterium]
MSERSDRYFTELMAVVAETSPPPSPWPGAPPAPLAPLWRPVPGWAMATAVAFVGVLVFIGVTGLLVRDGGGDVAAQPSQAVSIVTPDGVALRGDLWAGSDVAVVVVGAYGAAAGELDPITEPLAALGYTVVTYDPRAQGRSGGSVEPQLLDDDLGAAVAQLRDEGGAVYVVAYLHSGAAALAAAGEGRLDVHGLVGLFPMEQYLEQDALAAIGGVEVPLLLIGGSDRLALEAPPGTERLSLAPDHVIVTKSGTSIADLVDEFIATIEG